MKRAATRFLGTEGGDGGCALKLNKMVINLIPTIVTLWN
jgi:hypothetical protein